MHFKNLITGETQNHIDYDFTREDFKRDLKMQLIFSAVYEEFKNASSKHAPMRSSHEAFGIIYEEFVIEFAAAMYANDRKQQRAEMIQVAAMACRFLYDIGFPDANT